MTEECETNEFYIKSTIRLERGECTDDLTCCRNDGSHCKIGGPCIVEVYRWQDGGIDIKVTYPGKRSKRRG